MGALTGMAIVMILSTAVLAVCMMWRLARSRRRHIPQWNEVILGGGLTTDPCAGVEVRELGTNPTYQTTANLIPSSPNEAYATVDTQPVHYEDVM